jgi:hypothetical protein
MNTKDLGGMWVGQEVGFNSGMGGGGMHLQIGKGGIVGGGRQRGSVQRVSRGRVVRVRGRVGRHRSRRSKRRSGGESSDGSDFGVVLGTGDVATVDDRTRQGIGMLFISRSN